MKKLFGLTSRPNTPVKLQQLRDINLGMPISEYGKRFEKGCRDLFKQHGLNPDGNLGQYVNGVYRRIMITKNMAGNINGFYLYDIAESCLGIFKNS